MSLNIRPAVRDDIDLIAEFIRTLAAYEDLSDSVHFDMATLAENLFGERSYAEVLIGEIDGVPQGFALFFHSFSSFEGKPGLYLEDLFVRPEMRGSGLGTALLARLAQTVIERGCVRLEWSVLNWNEPSIKFYKSLGAEAMDGWTVNRIEGDALEKLCKR